MPAPPKSRARLKRSTTRKALIPMLSVGTAAKEWMKRQPYFLPLRSGMETTRSITVSRWFRAGRQMSFLPTGELELQANARLSTIPSATTRIGVATLHGRVSVDEYRTGHTLPGYAHLMQNANLNGTQDLGNVTELLSGRFFQPLGRSSAHQLWSSSMVISPAVRGLFGIAWDLPGNTLSVTTHLPADWKEATVRNVPDRKRT